MEVPHTADQGGRVRLSLTPALQSFLDQALASEKLQQRITSACTSDQATPSVPWQLLQDACTACEQQQASTRAPQQQQQQECPQVPLAVLCAGSKLLLPQPPARQRSQQLQQRLADLQERLDCQRYAAMVSDVTQDEKAAADTREDPFFPTTKLQLSFGLHVIVTMGTFYALAYFSGLFILRDKTWAVLCGCLGLVCGLLLETTLLIIRTNMPVPLDKKYAHLLDKSWEKPQQPRTKEQQQQGKQQQQQQQQQLHQELSRQAEQGASAALRQGQDSSSKASSKQELRRRRA